MKSEPLYDTNTVKEWLITYREKSRELFCQNERLERLEVRMVGVGAMTITDMPKAPSIQGDRLADLVSLKIELEESIGHGAEEQKLMRDRLEYVLGQIRSANERAVIRMRYIDGEHWDKISELLYANRDDYTDHAESYLRQVYREHGYALYHLARYFAESDDEKIKWYKEVSRDIKERQKRIRRYKKIVDKGQNDPSDIGKPQDNSH